MFFEDDICYCGNSDECNNISCFRHTNNRRIKEGIFTVGLLKDTEYCPGFKRKENDNEEKEKGNNRYNKRS